MDWESIPNQSAGSETRIKRFSCWWTESCFIWFQKSLTNKVNSHRSQCDRITVRVNGLSIIVIVERGSQKEEAVIQFPDGRRIRCSGIDSESLTFTASISLIISFIDARQNVISTSSDCPSSKTNITRCRRCEGCSLIVHLSVILLLITSCIITTGTRVSFQ
jgi:hypothetical protein